MKDTPDTKEVSKDTKICQGHVVGEHLKGVRTLLKAHQGCPNLLGHLTLIICSLFISLRCVPATLLGHRGPTVNFYDPYTLPNLEPSTE